MDGRGSTRLRRRGRSCSAIPAAGAKLLAHDLAAAVDIPLRLAVIADGRKTRCDIVLRDMRSLLGEEVTELADAFTTVLYGLAEHARDIAEAAG